MNTDQRLRISRGKDFGITIGIIMVAIALLAGISKGNWLPQVFIPGIILFTLALLYPVVLFPFAFIWLKIGWLLSRIFNPLIMAIMYFLIITPYAFLLRAFGKKFLNLRLDKGKKSYWDHYDPSYTDRAGLKKQF